MVQVIQVLLLVIGYLELVICSYSDTSETREVLHLDGIWNCYCERDSRPLEYREKHGLRKLNGIIKVPIPGSLIDFDSKKCLGTVWFERSFFVPKSWKYERKIFLRLDGLASDTRVWINGDDIETINTNFVELDVTEKLVYESENRIALEVRRIPTNQQVFPGISRSIILRSVPEILYIERVSVDSTVTNGTAYISYKAETGGLLRLNAKCISVQVLDKDNIQVAYNTSKDSLEGYFSIPNCNLWWPLCMDSRAGYLYTMKIGIRPINWSNSSLKINDKNFLLQGVRGSDEWARKPFNPSTDLKDITLLKWLNANAIVTNVPPSKETLDLTDEMGLFVILGSPKNVLKDVIIRYRHHPSVILWSISEGEYDNTNTSEYQRINDNFIDDVKCLDPSRPLTAKLSFLTSEVNAEMISKLDIITLGDENAYSDNDSVDRYNKPVIIMHPDEFLSAKNRIRTINFDSTPEGNERADSEKRNFSGIGEFYGNFIAYECLKGEILTLVDGIFNRNREPTTAADSLRSKFRPKRSPCPNRTPRCKFNKNRRKRMLK
ncbi:beta-glucuronidase-like isoform X2 [Episyrphus balteatus]|uniref:beta-glucuronidase-like isoform X2 n=1 Tax=Episyrphus balteatus TaxID=286459 RepID=UPI0024860664|nr:beta-glucuronidase-like isoform X2 [Episyrphus balteatus]